MRVFSTEEVAQALGVSPASARRVLSAYERVSGAPLPRDKRGEWAVPEGAMAHLEAARTLVRERHLSWEAALGAVLGKEASLPLPARREELSEVLNRLKALEEENRALRSALEEQTALLKRLAQALERPRHPWWRFWGH